MGRPARPTTTGRRSGCDRSTSPRPAGEYVSRPDLASAPAFHTNPTGRESDELLLATPGNLAELDGFGTAIYDNDGELVWWKEATEPGHVYLDAEQVTYRGEPAIAAFRGPYSPDATGTPEYVLFDTSYNEIATFTTKGGYPVDGHDIDFSEDGSRVLLESYYIRTVDLSPYGGPAEAPVIDALIQEQDVETGEVTFEWSALDHIPVTETNQSLTEPDPALGMFDYLHLNSVEYTEDGDLLVSARHTSTVYKLDRDTGEIVWRFGGEQSDFTFDDPTEAPSYQHDARLLPDGRLSVFDNGNEHDPQVSRGAIYEIDEEAMTARLVEDLRSDPPVFGDAMGSNIRLDNGHQLVYYGSNPVVTEFDEGEPVFNAAFDEGIVSYRVDRTDDWHGRPEGGPDVAVRSGPGAEAAEGLAEDGTGRIYMSWNGATDVRGWFVQAGTDADELVPVGFARRTGFETAAEITAFEGADTFKVTAIGPRGVPLGSTTITTS